MKQKLLSFFFVCSMLIGAAYGQERRISGRVTSSEGEGLPGVSIIVTGTSTGTQTNTDGNFNLSISGGARTITVSYIGFAKQVINLTELNEYSIVLSEDAAQLSEVVVTAMGVSRDKKALGYNVQSLNSETLNKAGTPSLSSAMQGKLSGVEIKPSSGMPGASAQVIIRGARSFTGNNMPLYVIDGMPVASTSDFTTGSDGDGDVLGQGVTGSDVANRAVDIDPNDIESMTVLKGQAAAALYGIRASNGVIVITTKSGKGLAKGKPVISFSSNYTLDKISRKPDLQSTWAQGTGGGFSPNSSMSWGPRIEDLANDPRYGGNVKNDFTDALGLHPNQYYVPQLALAELDPWATPTVYDNVGDFFVTGHTFNNSLNVSQATENGNYSIGLSNANQSGIIDFTGMERYGAKVSAETKLSEAWKTGFSGNYTQLSIDKAPGANDGILGSVFPAPRSYNLKGIPSSLPTDPYAQIHYRAINFNNPYWTMDHDVFNEKTNRFFGNAYTVFSPKINWGRDSKLDVKYQLGVDSYSSHYQDIYEYGSQGTAGKIFNYGVTSAVYNSLLTANYQVKLSDDFDLTALIGNEINQENVKRYSETGYDFNFGGWSHINNAITRATSEAQWKYRTVGFFGNLNLAYKNMLYLSATGRNDYVSSMPRNNRSFFYPSVSLSFVATELDALKNSDVLSYLKLRASYAEVGQAGTFVANYYSTPTFGGGFWNGSPIVYPIGGATAFVQDRNLYDPDLKPQNTQSKEFGLEARFFNDVLGFDYTYSRQDVKNQIFGVPLAGSTGAAQRVMNGGKIHTNAHELAVNVNPIKREDVSLSFGFNFTKMDNYVDELAPGVESIFLGGFTTPQVRAGIGDKFPVIYGGTFIKDDQGRILVDEDPNSETYGMPMAGGPGVIGKVSPDFLLGGNMSFTYKRFSLSTTFDWKNGGQMYSGTNGLLNLYGMTKTTEDRSTPFVYAGYMSDGTPNNIQRGGAEDPNAYEMLYNTVLGNIDEAYIYDASFIKMRELVLSYRVPNLKKVNLNVSAYVRNILIWSKLPNLDPESSQGNTNMGGAFERFSVPQTSSYGLGLNLTF